MTCKFKWKVVNKEGRLISCHRLKRHAQEFQRMSGKANVYVRRNK